MSRILVTGGAGFVGSHLVDRLVGEGHEVTVLDDLSTGLLENLENVKDKIDLRVGSILDVELVRSILRKDFDIIYHAAAIVGVHLCIKDPRDVFRVNVIGTDVLCESIALRVKKPKLVLFSTSEVAGKSREVPLKEDSLREFGSTLISRWVYGESKAIDEMLCFWQGLHFDFPVVVARLFNVIGPRQRGEFGMVVPKFINQALRNEPMTVYGDGDQTRCFTYVGDVVKGVCLLGTLETAPKIMNLGNPRTISINSLAQLIKNKTNSDSTIVHVPFSEAFKGVKFDEIYERIPDITLAKEYGFNLTLNLEDVLDECIDFLKRKLDNEGK